MKARVLASMVVMLAVVFLGGPALLAQEEGQPGPGDTRVMAEKYWLGIYGSNVWYQPLGSAQWYQGILIQSVYADSPAAKAKLEAVNHIIIRVDNKRVKTVEELSKALDASSGMVSIKVFNRRTNKNETKSGVKLEPITPFTDKSEVEP